MNKIEFGDCREIMKRWIDEGVKVQTCVTSPPYFGLRDYGVDGQIGLEQTVGEYVANMVDVFRHVWHILEDDGTVWLNLGDSYYNYRPGTGEYAKQTIAKGRQDLPMQCAKRSLKMAGLKNKDLIGIPWRVAFALQEFGWYLRQDIIWHKPNPMPESVTDRCTKSHEYIFLLSKSPQYYFDHLAIKEQGVTPAGTKGAKGSVEKQNQFGVNARPPEYKIYDGMRNKRDVWSVNVRPYKGAHFATYPTALIEPCILAGSRKNDIVFDPFMGSGTTAQVALQHGRQYLGCELNKEYEKLQQERINNGQGQLC
jgi:DNA modification methylase